MSTTGSKIKRLREQKGLTQLELANMIGFTSKSSIAKIEKDARGVSMPKIKAIAEALHVSVLYLIGLEDEYGNPIQEEAEIQVMIKEVLSKLNEDELMQVLNFAKFLGSGK